MEASGRYLITNVRWNELFGCMCVKCVWIVRRLGFIYARLKVRFLRVYSDIAPLNRFYTCRKVTFSENYGFRSLRIFGLGLKVEATFSLTYLLSDWSEISQVCPFQVRESFFFIRHHNFPKKWNSSLQRWYFISYLSILPKDRHPHD